MSIVNNSTAAKLAAGLIGLAMAFSFVGATSAQAQTVEDLTAQINALLETIAQLQADLAVLSGGGSTSAVCPYTWTVNLTNGSTGADVLNLQKFLNSDSATQVAASGVGSSGNETDFFGSLTRGGVTKFQDKYATEVLTPVGLSAGTGYFGPSTRAHINSLCTTSAPSGDGDGDGGGDVSGTGMTVLAGVQPANTLAPQSAARVPFTTFSVTAGSDGDVVMDSVTVERTGLANDSAFAGIVLLDGSGVQLGTAKVLNSSHQVKVGVAVTIPSGQTRTFTIAGNMAANLSLRAGEVASLSVIGINTSATVSGSLPITGAAHTINASLLLGSASAISSSFDPQVSTTKEIGVTAYKFSGIKIEAGSAEKIRIQSIKWNQTGSVSGLDLGNVVTVADGVEFPTTLSADGNFYTTVFPGGLLIDKGFSKDIYIKADIVGSNSAGRTAVFDIDESTDIFVTG
ncbi:hypothetical protein IID27_00950, partial [Patescibacteria group bacterium]|nr:hypothetical protein [Patescibacteria group bacterium]